MRLKSGSALNVIIEAVITFKATPIVDSGNWSAFLINCIIIIMVRYDSNFGPPAAMDAKFTVSSMCLVINELLGQQDTFTSCALTVCTVVPPGI